MCGIVGYIGEKDATPIILNGLKKLEYRGYDFHYNTPVFGQVRKSDGKVGARWYGVTPDHIALLTKV